MEDKYVVIKQERWDMIMSWVNRNLPELDREAYYSLKPVFGDAPVSKPFFVIMSSDVFGPAGLYAYANNIRTALELGVQCTDTERERLQALADDLVDMAHAWQIKSLGRIPD